MPAERVSQAVARRDKGDQLIGWLRKQQDDIAMAAASHIKPSTVVRVTQGALRRNDKLAQAAVANPPSLLYALLDCARLGHEPDTDDYYLVPYGNEVQGIEGYKGIVARMFNGGCLSVVAQVVRQRDQFRVRGENVPPDHDYDPFASDEQRGAVRGAYAYAVLPSGRCSQVIVMGRPEIDKHKAKSRGSDKADSPWQQWYEAMAKKTVLRALEPYVPTATEKRHDTPAAAPAPAAGLMPAATQTWDATTASPEIRATAEPVDAEIVEDSAPAAPPVTAEAETPPPEGVAASPAGPETPPGPAGQPTGQKRALIGVAQQHFHRLGYTETEDDRQERLVYTAAIAGVPEGTDLASTNDLDVPQLRKLVKVLERCRDRQALIDQIH